MQCHKENEFQLDSYCESIEYAVLHFSYKIRQKIAKEEYQNTVPNLRFRASDSNFKDQKNIAIENKLKKFSFMLELEKKELINAFELFLRCLESKNINYGVVNNNLWLLYKSCLLISHKMLQYISWTSADFAEVSNTILSDLIMMTDHVLLNLLDFEINFDENQLKKTESLLKDVKEFC